MPKKTVFHKDSGEPLECEPVDAAELVAGGEYTYEPAGAPSKPAADRGRDEVKAELTRLQVPFDSRAKTEILVKLLDDTKTRIAEAAAQAKAARIAELTDKGDECTEDEVAELKRLLAETE